MKKIIRALSMREVFKLLPAMAFVMEAACCWGQGTSPVMWSFDAAPLRGQETTIRITAVIPAGWHLYSQSMKEGGPIPTRINFTAGDDYILKGTILEEGVATAYYDDTYEMEVKWYTGRVDYLQEVVLTGPAATISGNVAYMTCNSELCIPAKQSFTIRLPSKKSSRRP